MTMFVRFNYADNFLLKTCLTLTKKLFYYEEAFFFEESASLTRAFIPVSAV